MWIRAVQGHSMRVIDDDQLLTQLHLNDPNLPDECVHGTYYRHWASIRDNGRAAGGIEHAFYRNHIHFSPYAPEGQRGRREISGMRNNCEVAIWIDMRQAIRDGIPFVMSLNQVILSPGIQGWIGRQCSSKAKMIRNGQRLRLTPLGNRE